MKKVIITLSLFILVMIGFGVTYYYKLPTLTNLRKATAEFESQHDKKLYEARKVAVLNYYLSGQHETDIKNITENASQYFSKINVTPKDIVIFDVDDTAVYQYHRRPDAQFIWENHPMLKNRRAVEMGTAIEPVLKLYNFLKKKGFKIIFLTSRSDNACKETQHELEQAGYKNFEQLICMPTVLAFDSSIKTADWKLAERKKLSESYEIIGSVGDRNADFEGGYTGFIVKLPNYIY